MDRFIQLAIVASTDDVKDSGLNPQTDEERERIGVLIGSGTDESDWHHLDSNHGNNFIGNLVPIDASKHKLITGQC